MEVLKNLPLENVIKEDNKVILEFLNEQEGELRQIEWYTQLYDIPSKTWYADDKKMKQVENWSQEYFGLPYEDLEKAVGATKDIYVYEEYDSLWERVVPFDEKDYGRTKKGKITEINLNPDTIEIIFVQKDGVKRRANMRFTEKRGDDFYIIPKKKKKAINNFNKLFGVPIENREEVIGKEMMVQVDKAFGNVFYSKILGLAEE